MWSFMLFLMFHMISTFIIIYWDDEGTSFITFVWGSLYPKEDNALKDENL
jgi:hypothetical protein